MIELKNIEKIYNKNVVLENINVNFMPGHIYGLIGRNGSGKSVLLSIICGLSKPNQGSVLYNGIDLYKNNSFLPDARALINGPGFIDNLSGLDNLILLANINSKITKERIVECFEQLDMKEEMNKKYKNYSLGNKQKLGIIQVIMEEPQIMIFDEPFNGLDDKTVKKIRKILMNYKKNGRIIIIATHIKDDLNLLCDTVYRIDDRKIKRIK